MTKILKTVVCYFIQQNGLSGAMLRRFHIACAVPNYLFLASANLVFVLGTTKTYYIVTTVYFGGKF